MPNTKIAYEVPSPAKETILECDVDDVYFDHLKHVVKVSTVVDGFSRTVWIPNSRIFYIQYDEER